VANCILTARRFDDDQSNIINEHPHCTSFQEKGVSSQTTASSIF
jgi:hypothetical protein